MAHIKGPDFVTLQVRDLEASRHFYTDILGLMPSSETRPNAYAFSTRPISMAIRKSSVDLEAVSHLGHGMILWLLADDAAALYNDLKSADVTIVQDLAAGAFG